MNFYFSGHTIVCSPYGEVWQISVNVSRRKQTWWLLSQYKPSKPNSRQYPKYK